MKHVLLGIAAIGLFLALIAEVDPVVIAQQSGDFEPAAIVKIESKNLPNPVQVHSRVISGGLPEDDAAFAELAKLGVKTIISVDGAKPEVDAAKKYGMRYVHLPHGYDGIPQSRIRELAKAVRDLDGPIYIHCHHGKHRSPAAASVACVAAGLIPAASGVEVLELAGTSPNYLGLFESVRNTRSLNRTLLDGLQVEFREIAEIPPMAEAMVALGHAHDHLNLVADAGWAVPADHPDLDPAHVALLLREHFTELLRIDEVRGQTEPFRQYLVDSEQASRQLEAELQRLNELPQVKPPASLARLAKQITDNCKECHRRYRDVPLGQK